MARAFHTIREERTSEYWDDLAERINQARRESMPGRLRNLIYGSPCGDHVAMYVVPGERESFDRMYRGVWTV